MKYFQLITSNANKLEEYRRYAEDFSVPFYITARPIDIPELQNSDPETVLLAKVAYVAKLVSCPFLVEDTVFTTARYKNFPGTNAKFVNAALGVEGWKRLFDEGDPISAMTTIGLSYLGKTYLFHGRLDGVISFTHHGPVTPAAPINSLFFLPAEKAFLGELVKDERFENHRKKAFKEFFLFVKECERDERVSIQQTAGRWDKRAETWGEHVQNPDSYVNFESGYERFSTAVAKFLPTIVGEALDFGCGNGDVARQLSENPNVHVTGIDISGDMVRVAERVAGNNLRFARAAMSDLPEGQQYDCMTSRGIVLSHLPFTAVYDTLRAVTERAKPGAFFIFDFLQNAGSGEFPSAHPLNVFSLEQLCRMLGELGWVPVFADGSDAHRVRTAVFHKCIEGGVYFATGNPQKVQELNQAVGASFPTLYPYAIEFDEIKSDDLEKIVAAKLRQSYAAIQKPVMCTDGGVFIEALNGFPGENSKQAAQKLGAAGLLKLMASVGNRKAVRRNCIGYYDGSVVKTSVCEVICDVGKEIRQAYPSYEIDKILIPVSEKNPNRLTYAEMPVSERVVFTELAEIAAFIRHL